MTVTIKDIAHASGVSYSTVSGFKKQPSCKTGYKEKGLASCRTIRVYSEFCSEKLGIKKKSNDRSCLAYN